MGEELYDMDTEISCDQLSNFMHDIWMAVTKADSVLEIELQLDVIEDSIGRSLAPCVGYEVLNGLTDNWDSNSKVLDALKADAKDIAQRLHREGKDDPTGADKMSAAKFNMFIKRIEQLGKDPKGPATQSLQEKFKAATSQCSETPKTLAQSQLERGVFSITSVTKDDIIHHFREKYGEDNQKFKDIEKVVEGMQDHQMERLASKMADDYLNQLYWESLDIIFEERLLGDEE